MDYSEEEVIKILKIQIMSLKRLGDLTDAVALEIAKHRDFIRQMLLSIKKARDGEGKGLSGSE